MRKVIKRKARKRRKKILIMSLLCFSFFMVIGYASFSTKLSIGAKGNIYDVSEKCFTTVDNGDGTVTITDYDESCGTTVDIPRKLRGLTVTKIGDKAFYNKGLVSLNLPDTLIEIGKSAFNSNGLTSLEVPASVQLINWYAFRYNKLTTLSLNEGLKTIGLNAFAGNYLTEINIPKSVNNLGGGAFTLNSVTGDDAFIYGRNSDGSIDYSTLVSYAGKNATGTTIPSTVTKLGAEAYSAVRYDEIDIPSRIEDISSYCFNGTWAKKVTFHDGLKSIGYNAFSYTSIASMEIPSTVININSNAFSFMSSLKTININKASGSISGSPWGAEGASVNWLNS